MPSRLFTIVLLAVASLRVNAASLTDVIITNEATSSSAVDVVAIDRCTQQYEARWLTKCINLNGEPQIGWEDLDLRSLTHGGYFGGNSVFAYAFANTGTATSEVSVVCCRCRGGLCRVLVCIQRVPWGSLSSRRQRRPRALGIQPNMVIPFGTETELRATSPPKGKLVRSPHHGAGQCHLIDLDVQPTAGGADQSR
jgi:hypothetical protein